MGTGAQQTLWPSDERRATPVEVAIHYVCRKPAHVAAPSRAGRGGLTWYRGRWAYCDGAVDDQDHDWAPTGGVPIDQCVDWTKAMDPMRGTSVRGAHRSLR